MRQRISSVGRAVAAALVGGAAAIAIGAPAEAIPLCGAGDLECEIPDPGDAPLDATFTWFMPQRFQEAWEAWDEQGVIDDPQHTGYAKGYVDPGKFSVYLDACNSRSDPVVRHSWRVVGENVSQMIESGGCRRSVRLEEGRYQVTHTEVGNGNETAIHASTISVEDHLIISLGDSNASGEGNPDDPDWGPGDELDWQDDRCHRSATSGPALAAEALEDSDPHSSVTFLSFACSGAEVMSGLVEEYVGIEPPSSGDKLPSQVRAAKRHLCGDDDGTCTHGVRSADALLISAGVNDLGFADIIRGCALSYYYWFKCHLEEVVTAPLSRAFGELPGRYASLANALTGPLAEVPVYITEYPADPFHSAFGGDGCGALGGVDEGEAAWIAEQGARLNRLIRSAALQHGWASVGGITEAFAGHGYCAYHTWFRGLSMSYVTQNNINGVLHPNRQGHLATAAAINDALEHAEALDPTPTHRATVRMDAVRITDTENPDAGPIDATVLFRSSATATGPGGASAQWGLERINYPGSGDATLPLGEWVDLPPPSYTLTVDLARWQNLLVEAETELPPAGGLTEECEHIGKPVPGCFDRGSRELSIVELLRDGAASGKGTHTATASEDGATLELRYTVSVSPLVNHELEPFYPPDLPRW